MRNNDELKLAVLIDADNVPYSNIKGMLEEIAKLGTPTIKRIYGDWTKPNLSGWKTVLLENAITPIQQYGYTTGKNSTDSAMIIDAMDILHSDKVEGFCLVTSDSDFTRLAIRLRESSMMVIGIGEKKTPNPFIVACDKFIYIEIISKSVTETKTNTPTPIPVVDSVNNDIIALVASTVSDLGDENGWAFLAEVGNLLIKKKPDFDPRNYGFPKLTPLIKSLKEYFDIDERDVEGKKNIKHIYLKNKR